MFLYPETLVVGLPLMQRVSQAIHFSHQARPFKNDSEEAKIIRDFLKERATQRKGNEKIWDFPDGSSVEVDENGFFSVARAKSGLFFEAKKLFRKNNKPLSS